MTTLPDSGDFPGFEVRRVLGRGGMGEVYLAQDLTLQRQVALKRVRADAAGTATDHLLQEARHLASLSHPHIVQVYDVLQQDDCQVIVMEYVDGLNLQVYLREQDPELSQRLCWLADIAEALGAAHSAGVTHCDLKAENVLIGADGRARVTDFGIARKGVSPSRDVKAFYRLSQELLSGYENLSPRVVETLRPVPWPGKRANMSKLGRELRLAWHESLQEETLAADPPRRLSLPVAIGLLSLGVVVLLGMRYVLERGEPIYVAVAAPAMAEAAGLNPVQQSTLLSAVREAVHQMLIQSRDTLLIDPVDLATDAGPVTLVGRSSGADEVITSAARCSELHCDISLQRARASDGVVLARVSFPVRVDTPLETYAITQAHWSRLYPAGAAPTRPLISETDFAEYLELHRMSQLGGVAQGEVFQRTGVLLGRIPRFEPVYALYANSALELFDEMGDPAYLRQLERVLDQANGMLGPSDSLRLARIKLEIEREAFSDAARLVAELEQLSRDDYLINKLRADLYAAQGEYELAGRHYSRALAGRSSVALYYNAATNAYFGGRALEAIELIQQSLALYPEDAGALDFLGFLLLEKGEIDAALEHLQQSIELQPHVSTRTNLGLAYMLAGQFELALESFELAMQSGSTAPALVLNAADAHLLAGRRETAHTLYRSLIDGFDAGEVGVEFWMASQAYAHLGMHKRALSIVQGLSDTERSRPDASFNAALVYTLAGERLAAVVEVGRALDAGYSAVWFTLPWFDALCDMPDFSELIGGSGVGARCLAGSDYRLRRIEPPGSLEE